jgi:purine nucleosidase
LAGRPEIMVYAGAVRPMVRDLVTAEHVHGKTGLDGPVLPEPSMPIQQQHGVDFIIETLMGRAAGTVTLCTLGPLTNVALAIVREPRVASRIARIVAMGGGFFEGGNVTPAAEFNIYVDPHAARIVFAAGIPITLLPLDCTHQALTTAKRVAKFRAMPNRSGPAVAALLDFFERFDEHKYGTDGGPLHDPCVIAWLLRPELFQGRDVNVAVECESELTMGMTVVDWWKVTGRPPNAFVVRSVNADGFFGLLAERIARLP